MKVQAFTKYGRSAASTRQRLLQYIPSLAAAGISVDYRPLLGEEYVRSIATGGRASRLAIARAYAARIRTLAARGDADVLWVYAELFPYLPSGLERLAFRRGVPVVYDFDDAFFHQYDDHPHPLVRRALRGKLEPLLRGASAVACGNDYLQDYAKRFNPRTTILPTVVDTDSYRPAPGRADDGAPVAIGWIGSPTTWSYVRPLLPLLRELVRSRGVVIRAVGAGSAAADDAFPGLELIDWTEASEVAQVQRMDVGIMPLPDERWARGKSGYKLIQYMACGVPLVASPVGVNREIVAHGANGFAATTVEEWRDALTRLIADAPLRRTFGAAGRRRAEERYSLRAHAPRLATLLRSARLGV